MTGKFRSRLGALLEKPVAVFGRGVSGLAVLDLLDHAGIASRIYDERAEGGAEPVFSLREARGHHLAVVSPGFAPCHPWMAAGRAAGCRLLAEMDFASCFWEGPVVAVTGTNGKTTTAEFLAYAYRCIGRSAVATGNNGYPFSRMCIEHRGGNAVAICEVSSFQAELLREFTPDALLWTNFEEDHLERHGSMRAYFESKWNLLNRLQSGRFFAGPSVCSWAGKLGARWPETAQVTPPAEGTYPPDSCFANASQRENLALIRMFWREEGLPAASLEQAASAFSGLPHRLRKIAEVDRVTAWDDSKATNFLATMAALGQFPEPVLWIGGGQLKGGDVGGFARAVAPRVKTAFLIGESAPRVAGEFQNTATAHRRCDNLVDAVRHAWEVAVPGDAVVFSPGFASLDMFENYAHRGICFEHAVLSLKKHPHHR